VKLSREQLEEKLARNPDLAKRNPDLARRQGLGPCAIVQKQEASDSRQPKRKNANTNGAGNKKMDGAMRPSFRVAVNLRVSDNRGRDADGALSTLLDCLVSAARRLRDVDNGDFNSSIEGR